MLADVGSMARRLKIKFGEVEALIAGKTPEFPKYVSQILNLANYDAQGTRTKVVGQMSELVERSGSRTLEDWEKWYKENHPGTIDVATDKVYAMVENFREALGHIDRRMVREWVHDLVIIKTYMGLRFQEAILAKVAQILNVDYQIASPAEESKGIDGFLGGKPVSIKPVTYKSKSQLLGEKIEVLMIYYEKKRDGINIEF